jgi:sRNA-binding regulator protein Hfq
MTIFLRNGFTLKGAMARQKKSGMTIFLRNGFTLKGAMARLKTAEMTGWENPRHTVP